jgi:cytochrome c oxidase cbb3-type subunit 3
MSVRERDPLTGHQTTGHEWNGITELNTRVPRAVWFFIIITHIYALIVWITMPSWPLVFTYTKGLLGIDQRQTVEEELAEARAARAAWADRIAAEPEQAIREDAALMQMVRQTGPALFGDNCAVCHGTDARGQPGFPSLVDGDWLWGGDFDTIMETVRVGINAAHPETRIAQMPAFGRDGILPRDDVPTVVDYVQSLSGGAAPADVGAGAAIFAENCASCHGERGEGMPELGAPNLTDAIWIHGGDDASMFETVHDGRQSWMPAWENRLTLVDRKIVALYLLDLAAEQPR